MTSRVKMKMNSYMKGALHNVRMGKKVEKILNSTKDTKHQNNTSAAQSVVPDVEHVKSPEPYSCCGNFAVDFGELCRRANMISPPQIQVRPRPPQAFEQTSNVHLEEKVKLKGKPPQTSQVAVVQEEAESGDENKEAPPRTYTIKGKFEFFKPSIQVDIDPADKPVSEIHIRGWRIDSKMMSILSQCWLKLDKLNSIMLWRVGFDQECIQQFSKILPSMMNLKNFTLEANQIKPSQCFANILIKDSTIQNLCLRYNEIDDVAVQNICTNLVDNCTLITLNLTGNRITDEGLNHISNLLRLNRTLLTLNLSNNRIGDKGVVKLAPVLSEFALTHEEIVAQRCLFLEKGTPDRQKSIMSASTRRVDSRERPGSVRSSHTGGQTLPSNQKPAKSAKNKKDNKSEEKHDKGKIKKLEQDKKRASVVADNNKPSPRKNDSKTKAEKKAGKVSSLNDLQVMEGVDCSGHALLDSCKHLDNGIILLSGNRTLISLNLSYNAIGEDGVRALLHSVEYQAAYNRSNGLLRLNLNRNNISIDSDAYMKLMALVNSKDPFYQALSSSPDTESIRSKPT